MFFLIGTSFTHSNPEFHDTVVHIGPWKKMSHAAKVIQRIQEDQEDDFFEALAESGLQRVWARCSKPLLHSPEA